MSAFFILAKTVWFVLEPSHLLVWAVLASGVLLALGKARAGRAVAMATAGVLVVFAVLPIGAWLTRPLEDRYPRPPWPARVDGVLVLGGGFQAHTLVTRGAPAAAASEMRLVSAFALARRYPSARIVFSGGWGAYSDAVAARYIYAELGLDPRRLVLEDRSRDTLENLRLSKALARPRPGEVWVLATSAIQMRRAMLAARTVGWTLVPWPTDYLSPAGPLPLVRLGDPIGNILVTDLAAHEWLGLIAYRFRR